MKAKVDNVKEIQRHIFLDTDSQTKITLFNHFNPNLIKTPLKV